MGRTIEITCRTCGHAVYIEGAEARGLGKPYVRCANCKSMVVTGRQTEWQLKTPGERKLYVLGQCSPAVLVPVLLVALVILGAWLLQQRHEVDFVSASLASVAAYVIGFVVASYVMGSIIPALVLPVVLVAAVWAAFWLWSASYPVDGAEVLLVSILVSAISCALLLALLVPRVKDGIRRSRRRMLNPDYCAKLEHMGLMKGTARPVPPVPRKRRRKRVGLAK